MYTWGCSDNFPVMNSVFITSLQSGHDYYLHFIDEATEISMTSSQGQASQWWNQSLRQVGLQGLNELLHSVVSSARK